MSKKPIKENLNVVEAEHELANNLDFFVVKKSKDPMDNAKKLCYKSNPVEFANSFGTGVMAEDIHGFYLEEEECMKVAESLAKSVYEAAFNLEQKKSKVSEKLQRRIDALQRQVNLHLKAAKEDPANADDHQDKAEMILARIRDLRGKHKMVEGSKKELAKREAEMEALKEAKQPLKKKK